MVEPASHTPYGKTSRRYRHRLKAPVQFSFPERLITILWEHENKPQPHLQGPRVARIIAHQCTSHCTGKPHHDDGHKYRRLTVREVHLMSATVQWMATNCGRAFMHRFSKLLKDMDRLSSADQERFLEELRNE